MTRTHNKRRLKNRLKKSVNEIPPVKKKSFLEQKGYKFLSRECDEITYMCIKHEHVHISNVTEFRFLEPCKECDKMPPSFLEPFIMNTRWKTDEYVTNNKDKFTLMCDNGHSWTGNLNRFKKLKNKNCEACYYIYMISEITPIKLLTDAKDVRYLKDIIDVMEDGVQVKYTVRDVLRKYKMIRDPNNFDSDSE